jgi:hypothetical protein
MSTVRDVSPEIRAEVLRLWHETTVRRRVCSWPSGSLELLPFVAADYVDEPTLEDAAAAVNALNRAVTHRAELAGEPIPYREGPEPVVYMTEQDGKPLFVVEAMMGLVG